jgi:hypothetical protein
MKQVKIGLLAVAAMVSFQSMNAQTVDEIVDKYETALGGKEKLLSLKSAKMIGSISVQGVEVGITVTGVQGVGSRNDISVPGMGEGFQVVNATKGWNFMPWEGQSTPEEVSADQLKSSQGLLDLQGLLVNYKEKGNQVELLGKEKADTAECYKLKITNKQGNITTLFIDAITFYRVRSITSTKTANGEVNNEISYRDFKKTEEGYMFPFSQTIDRGTIYFTSIETNKPVDEKVFTVN